MLILLHKSLTVLASVYSTIPSAVEPGNNSTISAESTAVLSVIRDAGAFGAVDVTWRVANPSSDISETSGRVSFVEGQRTASFVISALPDDNPEPAESYTVELSSVTGDGRLASSATMAVVTILQNDDPIRFDSSFAQVREGETATFTLIRGGQANGERKVNCNSHMTCPRFYNVQVL